MDPTIMDSPENAFYWQDLSNEAKLFSGPTDPYIPDGLPPESPISIIGSEDTEPPQLLTPSVITIKVLRPCGPFC